MAATSALRVVWHAASNSPLTCLRFVRLSHGSNDHGWKADGTVSQGCSCTKTNCHTDVKHYSVHRERYPSEPHTGGCLVARPAVVGCAGCGSVPFSGPVLPPASGCTSASDNPLVIMWPEGVSARRVGTLRSTGSVGHVVRGPSVFFLQLLQKFPLWADGREAGREGGRVGG